MKKKFIFSFIATACCFLSSCYEDEGNYAYSELPRFEVDSTLVKKAISITQFERLQIPSNLVYGGNKADLDFSWSVYRYDPSSYGENVADTIATTENFDQEITLQPNKYTLEFCATNRNNGLKSKMRYVLTVESYSGAGLMVFYSKGDHCDVDIVKTKTLIGSYSQSSVKRNFYTFISSNPKLTGNPIAISCKSDYLVLVTDKGAVNTSANDFSVIRNFDDLFWNAPSVRKPQGFNTIYSYEGHVLVNDGGVYSLLPRHIQPVYRDALAMVDDEYYASPYTGYIFGMGIMAYDKLKSRFIACDLWSGQFKQASNGQLRDLGMTQLGLMRGITMAGGVNYLYSFMKEKADDSKRHLLLISAGRTETNLSLVNDFDISNLPEIQSAQNYAVSELSPVFYYSTQRSIYLCPFSIDQKTVAKPDAPEWTSPDGEDITHMWLFNISGIDLPESASHKYMLVSTYDGAQGRLYILKTDMATGRITSEPIEVFDGFGKIGGVDFKDK